MTDPAKDNAFKPNWKQIRPMHKIDPHRPAYDTTERREKRFLEHKPHRMENLNARNLGSCGISLKQTQLQPSLDVFSRRDKQNGFNPITGAQYEGLSTKNVPPRGLRTLPERPAIPQEVVARKHEGINVRSNMREQRIVNEGLRPGLKQASVADNFDPRFNG
eukprot:157940-Prorocentrum_minimum.AAC.3